MAGAKQLVPYTLLLATISVRGFQLPNPFGVVRDRVGFGIVNPVGTLQAPTKPRLEEKKRSLLETVSHTNNGKTATLEQQTKVLEIVHALEIEFPPSVRLLSDPNEAAILDGIWYLQYTSPSVVGDMDSFPDAWKPSNAKEGDAKIETVTFRAKGSVSAAGIPVETANRVVQQNIDVRNRRVTNDISMEWGKIIASGRFQQSPHVPNRALVSFDTFEVQLNNGFGVDFGFLFPWMAKFSGSEENGWLETTFVDQDVRIGRGNKGTMFVLTRDPTAVQP